MYVAGVSGFAAGTGTIEMFGVGDATGTAVAVVTAVARLAGVAAVPSEGVGVAAPPQASTRDAIARRAAASRAEVRRGAKVVLLTSRMMHPEAGSASRACRPRSTGIAGWLRGGGFERLSAASGRAAGSAPCR